MLGREGGTFSSIGRVRGTHSNQLHVATLSVYCLFHFAGHQR